MEITFISQMEKRKITNGTKGLDKKNYFSLIIRIVDQVKTSLIFWKGRTAKSTGKSNLYLVKTSKLFKLSWNPTKLRHI